MILLRDETGRQECSDRAVRETVSCRGAVLHAVYTAVALLGAVVLLGAAGRVVFEFFRMGWTYFGWW